MSFLRRLLAELRRRHVYKVGAVYLAVAWVVIQGAAAVFPILLLPAWLTRAVTVLTIAGFPVALILAWAFEITPEGVRRTQEATRQDRSASGPEVERGARGLATVRAAVPAVLLVAAALGVGTWLYLRDHRQGTATSDVSQIRSIAVLPFDDLSPAHNQAYLSEGISDELLLALGRIPGLRVAGRASAEALKRRHAGIEEIGHKLGVQAVLDGSVRKDGDELRISAQLVNARNGFQIWAHAFDKKLSDVFRVQEQIARSIAAALQVTLDEDSSGARPGSRIVRARTSDTRAYELYLQGRYAVNRRTPEAMRRAVDLFKQALARDSLFPLPWAGLADAYNLQGLNIYGPPADLYARGEAAARRALSLNDGLAEAHAALGLSLFEHERDGKAAEAEFRRSIQIDRSYPAAHYFYSMFLSSRGRNAEAVAQAKKAAGLEPLSPPISMGVEIALYSARRYADAATAARKTLALDASYFFPYFWLGLAESRMGDDSAAIADARRGVALAPENVLTAAGLGIVLARAGRGAEADSIATRLRTRAEGGQPVSFTYLAMLEAALGKTDMAIEFLSRARDAGEGQFNQLLSPDFDPIRSDPRFQAFAAGIGLPTEAP